MTRILAITVLAVGSVVLSGCAAAHRGTTVLKTDSGETENRVLKAPDAGMYALYAATDVKPKVVLPLKKGDALGFERAGDKIIAVAGENKLTYPDGTYYWNYRGKQEE